ncbi:kelch domain-containing protein 4-like [Liolophura sinensis]|uniref:kelch domain-containing protein 4-like n=1 Tax=Liolophura sinensis TaxID=3198878 RepID=UPI0031588011
MGKKTKTEKKGKGKEKTAAKTEKKADKRAKKELAEKGEEDIEKLIAEFQEQDKKRVQVVEEKCAPPSPRSNMTLTAHPDKDELIMFGGEYFTGNKMHMYNDLLFYNIKKNEWLKMTAPNAPPPRSSHQAVGLSQGGGQLWVFGGEFSSPTQSQFYHYKDLWVFHLREKRWEKVNSPGGPSSRSGHRMVSLKKHLFVFGGFHDNIRDYKYFSDVYMFSLDTYSWTKLDVSGVGPSPRSACQMAVLPELRRMYVLGGYSKEKVKKDVDKGIVHSDLFCLMPEGRKTQDDLLPAKWKWQAVSQSGARPSPRCGMSWAVISGNRALAYGGVHDEEDGDEDLQGVFYDELYCVDIGKGKWFDGVLRGKKEVTVKKKRRKVKEEKAGMVEDDGAEEYEEVDSEDEVNMQVPEEGIENLNIASEEGNPSETLDTCQERIPADGRETTFDDGVFKVTLGTGSSTNAGEESVADIKRTASDMDVDVFTPSARMNALLAVKNGVLYMYGGIYEEGDKQVTLSDMYSLDTHRLDEWKILIEQDIKEQVWEESDSSDEEGGGAKAMEGVPGESEESDDESDGDMELTFEEAIPPDTGEPLATYFSRTEQYWLEQAQLFSDAEKLDLNLKHRKQLALDLCQSYMKKLTA